MASQEQESVLDLLPLSLNLLAEQEVAPRAKVFARFVSELIADAAVSVYTLATIGEKTVWVPRATVGEAKLHDEEIPAESGLLGVVFSGSEAINRTAAEIKREDYPHIDIRKSLLSLTYLPLIHNETLTGALEILAFEEEISEDAVQALLPAAEVAAAAIATAGAYEEERHGTMTSITRLTQLYDLEKVFSSTLEMDELLPLIGTKISEILECQAVNIWLLLPDEAVELMHQAGEDATTFKGQKLKANEGVAGTISDNGEPICISDASDASDERLVQRNKDAGAARVFSLAASAILDKSALVGVVEAVNKLDGTPFDDDDLFTLSNLAATAATALHNASLLLAERKVEVLETLNKVSHEITSTLNLERMLQTIVNAPQAVIPYQRAAIVLEQGGRFKLSAVTGLTQVQADHPDIAPLNGILQWASLSEEVIHVRQHGEEIDAEREETKAKFKKYFEESGVRGFYARPLNDDTGRVGMLAMESHDPDFLGPAHLEIVEVLAGQATVALRNAQMYKEVPFISVLEPVLVRKRKFMAMQKRKRVAVLTLAAIGLLFLVACPLPLRVDGDAVVAPGKRALVQPEVEGVIGKVFVREGEHVQRGQVLAEMEGWSFRSGLAASQSKYETSMLEMNKALAANDGTEAGVRRVQADYWKAEVERAKQLVERTELRSPIEGVVATPHVEDFAGRKLEPGDSFAEVVDTSQAVVDVAVDDTDAGLLKAGQRAVVKLNSYPTRTFRGEVEIVSPRAGLVRETPVFYARVAVANATGLLRSGMEGRGKVRVGWYPSGYVLFRNLFLWAYAKIWYLLGW
ncbi:MAG TPA: efflux RND transporter periplasmic adaptor subunit [Candidatus Acidoferrum sp.]|nr:efflux RND transporter periplasmic adaptor subunit [Candidatus Acidoferrum sp.]